MNPELLIQRYLVALGTADLAAIGELFAPEAIVHSPLYGSLPATKFFPQLFSRTSTSRLELKGVFCDVNRPTEWIGYFSYEWTLTNGAVGRFDVCDVFRFDLDRARILELTIIYDTVRAPAQARLHASP